MSNIIQVSENQLKKHDLEYRLSCLKDWLQALKRENIDKLNGIYEDENERKLDEEKMAHLISTGSIDYYNRFVSHIKRHECSMEQAIDEISFLIESGPICFQKANELIEDQGLPSMEKYFDS